MLIINENGEFQSKEDLELEIKMRQFSMSNHQYFVDYEKGKIEELKKQLKDLAEVEEFARSIENAGKDW